MHPSDRFDHDWIHATESDTDLRPVTAPPFAGVFRVEAAGEDGVPFDTLLDATTEPPMTPEAEVRGKGGCLAQSNPEYCGWVYTMLGAQRIEREAGGIAKRAS
jgi:hypothetical protein